MAEKKRPPSDHEPGSILESRGALVAQSLRRLSSAQIMISRFVSLSPALGSLLSAQSPLRILCPPVSAPPKLARPLSLKNK